MAIAAGIWLRSREESVERTPVQSIPSHHSPLLLLPPLLSFVHCVCVQICAASSQLSAALHEESLVQEPAPKIVLTFEELLNDK